VAHPVPPCSRMARPLAPACQAHTLWTISAVSIWSIDARFSSEPSLSASTWRWAASERSVRHWYVANLRAGTLASAPRQRTYMSVHSPNISSICSRERPLNSGIRKYVKAIEKGAIEA
jgi:hypothetical protein